MNLENLDRVAMATLVAGLGLLLTLSAPPYGHHTAGEPVPPNAVTLELYHVAPAAFKFR